MTEGGRLGEETGLGTSEILRDRAEARPDPETVYVRWGDWVMAVLAGMAAWTRSRPRPKPGA